MGPSWLTLLSEVLPAASSLGAGGCCPCVTRRPRNTAAAAAASTGRRCEMHGSEYACSCELRGACAPARARGAAKAAGMRSSAASIAVASFKPATVTSHLSQWCHVWVARMCLFRGNLTPREPHEVAEPTWVAASKLKSRSELFIRVLSIKGATEGQNKTWTNIDPGLTTHLLPVVPH
jgi:hypothetical protein